MVYDINVPAVLVFAVVVNSCLKPLTPLFLWPWHRCVRVAAWNWVILQTTTELKGWENSCQKLDLFMKMAIFFLCCCQVDVLGNGAVVKYVFSIFIERVTMS